VIGQRTEHARRLFDGIASRYEAPAGVFSFWQYARWRRGLVRQIRLPPRAWVLDVASGTGAIARDLVRRHGCRVVGLDQSHEMMSAAKRSGVSIVGGQAERLPFADESFDGLVFSYLMRYVENPAETLSELLRVVRGGGAVASVEFGVPRARAPRALWRFYAFRAFPKMAGMVSSGWGEVGEFLPASIEQWASAWPPARQATMWRDAGIEDVRVRALSLGAGLIMCGRKR
jgi:demethylmenaquinone methyltransferase/2-methoxy-6-polyprenyl-1,4-benzoquinol methylase